MSKLKRWLSADEGYRANLETYTKKDGIKAILLFLIFCGVISIFAVLDNRYPAFRDFTYTQPVWSGIQLIPIIITILFVVCSKRRLDTIGLCNGKWKKILLLGLLLSILVAAGNIGGNLVEGRALKSVPEIFSLIIFYLFAALCEEIVFRGYIQTRICGLIPNAIINTLVAALLFGLMHLLHPMIANDVDMFAYVVKNPSWFLDKVVMHIVWSFIYRKTNSIYGAVLPHWVANVAFSIFV